MLEKKSCATFWKHYEEGISYFNGIGLRTNEAHVPYKRFGFGQIPEPENWKFKKMR
jgi:hypothetical protein